MIHTHRGTVIILPAGPMIIAHRDTVIILPAGPMITMKITVSSTDADMGPPSTS